jgi:superfamily II DNA/RNA helicase
MNYSDLQDIDPRLLRAVTELGYQALTPIQEKAIPVVLAGHDVMGAAQTGTGKTAAFSLPILHKLLPLASTSVSPARHPVRALILAPTRELADQVANSIKSYARYTPLRVSVVFGGVDMAPQTKELRAGVEVLVATPGRLLDHIESRNTSLAQVRFVVLDEADRMLDIGFLPDLQRILGYLPKERTTLLFSATFSPEIRALAKSFLQSPITVEVARPNATAATVEQLVYGCSNEDKYLTLRAVLQQHSIEQAIIFLNTKLGAARLARSLQRDGHRAGALHGDKSQGERLATLEAFKQGEVKLLVATDVAARGLDIAELPAVINFDVPFNAEDYVHRIGRTGRAGAEGLAISLAAREDARNLADIERLTQQTLTPRTIQLEDFLRPKRAADSRPSRGSSQGFAEDRMSSRTGDRQRGEQNRAQRSDRSRAQSARVEVPKSLDPFFTQPYTPPEPAMIEDPSSEGSKDTRANAPSVIGVRSKRKVASLLGGGKGS